MGKNWYKFIYILLTCYVGMYIQKILVKIKLLFFYLQARVESERWYPNYQLWFEIQSELWEESQIHSKNRDRTKLWFFQIFADSLDRHKVIIFSILNGQVVVSCQPLDCESCLFFYKSAKCEDQEEIFFKKSTYRETFKWGNYWFLPFL